MDSTAPDRSLGLAVFEDARRVLDLHEDGQLRLVAARLIEAGLPSDAVSRRLGVCHLVGVLWVMAAKELGLEGLVTRGHGVRLQDDQIEQLQTRAAQMHGPASLRSYVKGAYGRRLSDAEVDRLSVALNYVRTQNVQRLT